MFKIVSFNLFLPFSSLLILMFCSLAVGGDKNIDDRVESLLSKMTLSEKIGQMTQVSGFVGEIPVSLANMIRKGEVGSVINETDPETSVEIQRIAIEESRLGIPLIMGRDVIHGFRTIFPIPLGQAASWNPELAMQCAQIAAKEAAGASYHWTFAPMMDITHDPRWGRIAEGFGEDPVLASSFSSAIVHGLQGDDLSAPNTLAACAKHFVGYGAAEGGRDYNTTIIPEGILRDLYLPPFKAAVDAGVATVMTSFNEVNGIPSSGNPLILRQILRDEWGFEGFVVSDWQSMEEMISHGFCEDMRDVALKSITAGVDMEMVSTAYTDYLEALVLSGKVPEALVNQAAGNILRIKLKLGLFDKPFPYTLKITKKPSKKALELAKQMSMESVVLLKCDNQILPLKKNVRSIAVIGSLADDPYEVFGTWSLDGKVENAITPLQAIQTHLADLDRTVQLNYAQGLSYSRCQDKSGFADAIASADQSDVILLFAGEEAILSGEGHSRAFLDLPGAQDDLIYELSKTDKPIILIVMAGRPLTIGAVAEKCQAVLYAWHPGTMCGPALADLIFGLKSPSGKLPVTFPKAVGQIPVYYNHKQTGRPPREGAFTLMDDIPVHALQHTLGNTSYYLDIGYLPLYPFGYGLSYTEFEYKNLELSSQSVKIGQDVEVSVDLSNIGKMAAVEIVQLYVRDLVGSLTRPVKELKGFQRIHLEPGEKKKVTFDLSSQDLGFHNTDMEYVVESGKFHLWVGGDSQSGLMAEFELVE
jgi:beta-glucosidase